MKRTRHAPTIAAAIMCAAAISGCATAAAEQPVDMPHAEFRDISDYFAPRDPEGAARIAEEQAAKAAQEQQEAAGAAIQAEAEYEPAWEDYGAYSGSETFGDGFMQQGVRYHEGRTETWYSSNVAYHYRTPEWTVDDEGYYRDDQGRYVVAASDVPEGSEIETSKGTGIVLDGGCDEGVTDFYTAF